MPIGMSMRTIFLVVRGQYQAQMAMRMARADIKELNAEQKKVIQTASDMKQAAQHYLFAGVAFTAFGGMVLTAVTKIMEKSRYGELLMRRFGATSQRSMEILGNVMARTLTPLFNLLIAFLDMINRNPALAKLIGTFIALAGPIFIVIGLARIFQWIIMQLSVNLFLLANRSVFAGGALSMLADMEAVAATKTELLTVWMTRLGTAVNVVLGAFMITFSIVSSLMTKFGALPAVIGIVCGALMILVGLLWSAAVAQSILTIGVGVAVGATAALLAYRSMKNQIDETASYQYGTDFVKKGGLAIVHGGEKIISARQSVSTALQERRNIAQIDRQGAGVRQSKWDVNIHIGQVQTKADKEELTPLILKTLRDATDNKV